MVDEDQMQTVHLYAVPEDELPPKEDYLSIVIAFMSFSFLLFLILASFLIPPASNEVSFTVSVRAYTVVHGLSVLVPIIPTGSKTYPATQAYGILTIYNGSILPQEIPTGMIFTANGIEVITDTSVFVPAGNPPTFGIATVKAHAVIGGVNGNIPAYAINQVEGASIYIRNLSAFTGGRDSYLVKIITQQDIQRAENSVAPTLQKKAIARLGYVLELTCTTKTKLETRLIALITVTCTGISYSTKDVITVIEAYKKNIGVGTFLHVQTQVVSVRKQSVNLYVTAVRKEFVKRTLWSGK